jgi:alpha-galactosidase
VTSILDQNDRWHEYAGPGGWNDPDMLEVGNGDLTLAEQRSHFTLWCLAKAPLLLGADVRNIEASALEIISNQEVIALNQDPLGVQGFKRTSSKGLEVWAGPLERGHIAVVLFNRSPHAAPILATWTDIGLSSSSSSMDVPMQVLDLWKHEDLGVMTGSVTALVESHDVVALRLSPVEADDHETNQQ